MVFFFFQFEICGLLIFCSNEMSFTFLCDSSALQPLKNGRCLIDRLPLCVCVCICRWICVYNSLKCWRRSIEQMLIKLVHGKKCFLWFFFLIHDCLLVSQLQLPHICLNLKKKIIPTIFFFIFFFFVWKWKESKLNAKSKWFAYICRSYSGQFRSVCWIVAAITVVF